MPHYGVLNVQRDLSLLSTQTNKLRFPWSGITIISGDICQVSYILEFMFLFSLVACANCGIKLLHVVILQVIVILLWVVCVLILTTCLFGGFQSLRSPEFDRIGNSFYIALTRPIWSLCVAWIIWACANNYGGMIHIVIIIF